MDGIDLAILAAAKEVRPQHPGKILMVLPAGVVVLDLQVAVIEKALCDDEIVRLVAARQTRRDVPEPNRAQDKCECAGGERCPLRIAQPPILRDRRSGAAARRQTDEDRRPDQDDDRPGPEQKRHGDRSRQPRQPQQETEKQRQDTS